MEVKRKVEIDGVELLALRAALEHCVFCCFKFMIYIFTQITVCFSNLNICMCSMSSLPVIVLSGYFQ